MVKNPPTHAGDVGSIPGWERSLEEEEMATHSSPCLWCPKEPDTIEDTRTLLSLVNTLR